MLHIEAIALIIMVSHHSPFFIIRCKYILNEYPPFPDSCVFECTITVFDVFHNFIKKKFSLINNVIDDSQTELMGSKYFPLFLVHEFLKKIKPRGGGVGVKYGGCEGARDVST